MKKIPFVVCMVMSLILASCGGKASGPSTKIDVTMTDFQFQPNAFTVPAGQEITLNAKNNGGVVHSFVIMNKGQSAGTEFTDQDQPNVYWQVEIQPGGSTDTTFMAPADAGDYEVVCHVPGHLQAGMVGKLTVVANQ
ncbi:MAG: cupredoxin domain-containing protein [Bacteroidota bacterium]|jgi:uncharacterized cupredoxin-like copper-binding protein